MLKTLALIGIIGVASVSVASAACPPSIAGTTAEAIRANEQRVICLQQDVEENSRIRKLEIDIQANETAINRIQLERRFDALPKPIPSPFAQPSPFVSN